MLGRYLAAAAVLLLSGPAPVAAQPAHDAPALILATDGLALRDMESDEESRVGFGMDQDDAVSAVGTALGEPESSDVNEDCDAGPLGIVDFQGGMRLFFRAGEFVGWSTQGGWSGANGIRVGLTFEDVAQLAGEVRGEESSLGPEFSADGYSGLLSEAGAEGRVSTLWAGTICSMR
jgi:hypothetical protein